MARNYTFYAFSRWPVQWLSMGEKGKWRMEPTGGLLKDSVLLWGPRGVEWGGVGQRALADKQCEAGRWWWMLGATGVIPLRPL